MIPEPTWALIVLIAVTVGHMAGWADGWDAHRRLTRRRAARVVQDATRTAGRGDDPTAPDTATGHYQDGRADAAREVAA